MMNPNEPPIDHLSEGIDEVHAQVKTLQEESDHLRQQHSKFLEQQQALTQFLSRHSGDCIFAFSILENQEASTFTLVNEPFCNLLEYEQEELLTISPVKVMYQDDPTRNALHIQWIQEKLSTTTEEILTSKSGKKISVKIHSHWMPGQKGLMIISIIRTNYPQIHGDSSSLSQVQQIIEENNKHNQELNNLVSEYERMNEEVESQNEELNQVLRTVEESEIRFRRLFEQAGDPILIYSIDGNRFIDVNSEATFKYGFARDEWLTMNPSVVEVEPHANQQFQSLVMQMREGGFSIFETFHRKKNGTIFPVEISSRIILLEGEELVHCICRDITKRKINESLLRESEKQFKDLVENINDVIYQMDRKGTIRYISPAIERVSSYSADQMIGTRLSKYIHPEDMERVNISLEEVLKRKKVSFDFRFIDQDGSLKWMQSSGRLHFIKDGMEGIQGILTDITANKEYETKLEASLTEKDTLLREIYHRTKNNMQVITSMLAIQAIRSGDPEVKRMVKDTTERIQSISLVHQKLYQSQSLSSIDLKEYTLDLVHLIFKSYGIQESDIELDLSIDPLPLTIDVIMPMALLLNELITNSIKHAFPQGEKGVVKIKVTHQSDGTMCLTYWDNGVGLPLGFDIKDTQTLGLQIVYNIVTHQLNGTIHLDRTDGLLYRIEFHNQIYT